MSWTAHTEHVSNETVTLTRDAVNSMHETRDLEVGTERVLECSRLHAGLLGGELELHVEAGRAVHGDIERLRHHRGGRHVEGDRGSVHAGVVVGQVARRGLQEHAAAGPVLIHRDEREEVDLLRDRAAALAGRLRRRPLVARIDPVRAAEAAVEGVALVDRAGEVGGERLGVVVVAEGPREQGRRGRGAVEEARRAVDVGLIAVFREVVGGQDLHRRVRSAGAAGVVAVLDVAAEDAALKRRAASGGARRVEGAHCEQSIRRLEARLPVHLCFCGNPSQEVRFGRKVTSGGAKCHALCSSQNCCRVHRCARARHVANCPTVDIAKGAVSPGAHVDQAGICTWECVIGFTHSDALTSGTLEPTPASNQSRSRKR
eukprot:3264773-Rhodomonas_salina.1